MGTLRYFLLNFPFFFDIKHKKNSPKKLFIIPLDHHFWVQQVFVLWNWDSFKVWNFLIFEVVKLCRMKKYLKFSEDAGTIASHYDVLYPLYLGKTKKVPPKKTTRKPRKKPWKSIKIHLSQKGPNHLDPDLGHPSRFLGSTWEKQL